MSEDDADADTGVTVKEGTTEAGNAGSSSAVVADTVEDECLVQHDDDEADDDDDDDARAANEECEYVLGAPKALEASIQGPDKIFSTIANAFDGSFTDR